MSKTPTIRVQIVSSVHTIVGSLQLRNDGIHTQEKFEEDFDNQIDKIESLISQAVIEAGGDIHMKNVEYLHAVMKNKVKHSPDMTVQEWYDRLYAKPQLRGAELKTLANKGGES